jgi:hypothetical protein
MVAFAVVSGQAGGEFATATAATPVLLLKKPKKHVLPQPAKPIATSAAV